MKNPLFPIACFLSVIVLMGCDLAAAEIFPRFTFVNPATNSQIGTRQGYSVALSDKIAAVGAPSDNTATPGGGVVKVYDLATGGLLHTIISPDSEYGDGFGLGVAVSGSRIAVAAPWKDDGVPNAGRVYVFDLVSDSPTVAALVIPNPEPSLEAQFGSSIAMAGSRLVVGLPMVYSIQQYSGKVFVYDLDGAHPDVPSQVMSNPAQAKAGAFGSSVAISGTNLVVAALNSGTGTNEGGVAYVYGLGETPNPAPYLALLNPRASSAVGFGSVVGISGRKIVVGAPFDSFVTNQSGSVFVYNLDSSAPDVPVVNWGNPSPAKDDIYGASVAMSESRLVVGAPRDDSGAMNSGLAYVYDLSAAESQNPISIIPNPTPAETGDFGDFFGESVAIHGEKMLVGAQYDDSTALDAGSAYLFDLGTADPTMPVAVFSAPSPSAFDRFGSAVGVSGSRVVVGVPADDSAARDSGAAYVYDIASVAPSVPLLQLTNPSAIPYESFGKAAAISGTRVVIGVPDANAGAIAWTGRAYVYDLTAAAPAQPWLTLTNPQPAESDAFGSVIVMSGSRVAIGVPVDGAHASQFGSVYVYDLDGAIPSRPVLTFTNPIPVIGARFGESVALSGRLMAVSTLYDQRVTVPPRGNPTPAIARGRVYVYDLDSSTPMVPIQVVTNRLPVSGYSSQFNPSMALHGSYLAVVGSQTSGDIRVFVHDLNSPDPHNPISVIVHPFLNDVWDLNVSIAMFERRVVLTSYKRNERLKDNRSVIVFDLDREGRTDGREVLVTTNSTVLDSYRSSAQGPVVIDGTVIISGNANSGYGASGRGAVDVYRVGPRLKTVISAPGAINLSWMPASLPGFALEWTESLSSPTWTPMPGVTVNPRVVSTTNNAGFFRLRQE